MTVSVFSCLIHSLAMWIKDAAKIAADHLAAERSLARSVNTGTESKQGRASRCFRLHCRDKVMAETKMVRKRHNTPQTERKDGQSDVIDTSQSRKSPPATPNTNYKLQNVVFGLRFRNSAQPVNLWAPSMQIFYPRTEPASEGRTINRNTISFAKLTSCWL